MKYILTFLALWANLAHGQYSLALNLEKGNSYFLKISSTIHFNGEMNGRPMSISSTMSSLARFKVVGVSATGYDLDASYDSMHMTMRSPMGRMEFSSENTQDNDSGSEGLPNMASKHFKLTLLKNGAVSKIENPDSSGFSSLLKNFPMAEMIKKALLGAHLKQSFNAQAMKENIEKLTAIFPNKKVALNESWGSSIHPDSNMNNSIQTSYQLTGYQSGVATIKGHSESKAGSAQKQGKGFPASYDLEGKSESTLEVDTGTGWIKDANIKSELKGQIQFTNPAMKEGKAIPIQISTDTKISS